MTEALKQYERDGYVIFRGVLDADLIAEVDAHIDWLIKRYPDKRPEALDTWAVKDDPFWVRLVSDQRLLDVAERFIGPDIALFASHYICKPPKTGQAVLWHQDGAYWPLEPMKVVTLWLAVNEVTPENGCMRVVPGTHRTQLTATRERRDVDNVLASETELEVDESDAVDIVLDPGDVEVHHPNIIHGSNANTSDRWRKGLTIRYIPASTRITKPGVGAPFLLRGDAVEGVNDYLPRPAFVDGEHMPFRGAEAWA